MSLILHLNPECQEMRAQFEQIRWIEGYMSDKWPDLGLISWIRAMFGTYRVEIETLASISAEIALNVQKWRFKLCEKLYSFVKTLILAAGLANSNFSGSQGCQAKELSRDLSHIFVNIYLFSHLNSKCRIEMGAQFNPIGWIEDYMPNNLPDLAPISLMPFHIRHL